MGSKRINQSRREFLKGSLAAGATGLMVGLTGCAPKIIESESDKSAALAATPSGDSGGKKYSWETPPAPIAASDIKSKKSTDVVVLGAGISGLCAAYAAADAGAKVILLERRNTFTFHGGWNGVVGDRQHQAQGVDIPKDKVMADVMRYGAYHPNPRLIQTWLNESGRVMNKILDMADAAGIKYAVDADGKEYWPYEDFKLPVIFLPAMNGTLIPLLEKNVKEKGVDILYETPAAQLLRDSGSGKVTGVIAKGKDGYIQVDATKGVIICTGGYSNNKEMLEKYAPRALKIVADAYVEGSSLGEGILMGMWVGATKQETSCPMLWDGWRPKAPLFLSIARQPFLNVNTLGERYANEDAPFGYTANQDIEQPESMKWTIWDANWETDKDKFHGTVCENMKPPFWNPGDYENYQKSGDIIPANTLEELADKMQVPKDTFLATVKRYNDLVQKGIDEDFGKDPAKMTAIVKAPFGASKVGTALLVTCDGLRINTEMQVLDTQGKPIPGLYAAGNASGDFFANDYPITSIGSSHGRALTFGWLAGEIAAKV
jgi:fumarate reductase flavoprotein subunit